jgi:peptidoglycan/xylan/chitin deacetylase (PgdA/CDA1 family)
LPSYFETGPRTRPFVAITLDDVFEVSGAQQLRSLLDILYANDLPMTVFPTGSALKQHYDAGLSWIWQTAVATNLVEIGNHTYTHNTNINPDLTKLSDAQIADELNRTQAMLDQVLGYRYPMRLMRPPGGFGRGNARVIAAVNRLGYSLVGWDIGGDLASPGADYESAIINRKTTTNGSIVLSHFTTLRVQDYQPLFDDMRLVRHLQPTTVTGLFRSG